MKYLTFIGKKYYLDLQKYYKFTLYTDSNQRQERELIDNFELDETTNKMLQTSKVLREITTPNDTKSDTVKFDIIKTLVEKILNCENYLNDEEDNLTIGTALAFNTLIKEGILIEVNNE